MFSTATLHRAERQRFERDLARWEDEHTDPNEDQPAPIRGGSEDHGRVTVSLFKLDDPWTALLTPEQRERAAADVPF